MLQQKARVDCFKFGDNNTKFFHAVIKKKVKKKTIAALKNDNDEWFYDSSVL